MSARRRKRGEESSSTPRRLGEILDPALSRMATSDQARAYHAWARAAGDQVASGAHARYFNRGVLTVECASSVWANELTYLSPQILRRMDEVAPGHPVKRFRFMVGSPTAPEQPAADESADAPAEGAAARGVARAPKGPAPAPAPAAVGEALERAEDVHDERLRAAIEAALRSSRSTAPGTDGEEPPGG